MHGFAVVWLKIFITPPSPDRRRKTLAHHGAGVHAGLVSDIRNVAQIFDFAIN